MIPGENASMIAGIGSPVVDQVARVPESFLENVGGEKGGMELVDAETLDGLLAALPEAPARTPGGSAGNTTFALARLGMPCRFLGVVGDDAPGRFYRDTFAGLGGDAARIRLREGLPTAQCLSLVTPDGERTMRTHLGAAATLSPSDLAVDDLSGCSHVHIEGYLLFNPDLMAHVLETAKAAGCSTSVDMASFEVVAASRDHLPGLLKNHVDMVFANEEEAGSYADTTDPKHGLGVLAGLCDTVAVKCGAQGAFLCHDGQTCSVPAHCVERVVDTTGAGDLWAAGFLYGMFSGRSLARSGAMGAVLGAAVVQQEGAFIPDTQWKKLMNQLIDKERVCP